MENKGLLIGKGLVLFQLDARQTTNKATGQPAVYTVVGFTDGKSQIVTGGYDIDTSNLKLFNKYDVGFNYVYDKLKLVSITNA